MNFCYCDESGTGSDPVATMVGIVANANRMHVTKEDWSELLGILAGIVDRQVDEVHMADFYSGNGMWRGMDGSQRSRVVSAILEWLRDRRHSIVLASVVKADYRVALANGELPEGLDTLWRFMGFHMILALQRCFQNHPRNKGNTVFIFDNQERERARLGELILHPPDWSDRYYNRFTRRRQIDQVVDVPLFADSKHIGLLQVADCLAFIFRRHAEIQLGMVPPRYDGEDEKIAQWVSTLARRTIPRSNIYPRRGRNDVHELFFRMAPAPLRDL